MTNGTTKEVDLVFGILRNSFKYCRPTGNVSIVRVFKTLDGLHCFLSLDTSLETLFFFFF